MKTADLVIDSNLLVLLVAGLTSPAIIGRHKRLTAYDEEDFVQLLQIVRTSSRLILTPNVCTETSNHLRAIRDPDRTNLSLTFKSLIEDSDEIYISSRAAVGVQGFRRLGLADAVLLQLNQEGGCLLTADLDLYVAAVSAGHAAVNFMHLKDQRT